jgi:acyl transferase domain-containing protein/SAM-dependent methyltransferase
MTNGETNVSLEPIAIIGMAGRFPGARNIDEFWRNLCDGVESVSFFTDEELLAEGLDAGLLSDPNYVNANAVLDDVEMFDASFFGFTPREAEITDPQHRLFLECALEVLESAGHEPGSYKGRIGVYAGAGLSTYLLNNLGPNRELIRSVSDFQILMGNNKDYVPTRVSYKLNLKGPSVNINTACSTSLVAVHIACQSLLDYHCDMALAGGVGIQVPQKQGYLYQEGGIASPDGHCRAFDARAQGTVNGSGVGIVLLKRLDDALADGDRIRAIIKGSAINNDGSAKVGYTAPSVEGQAEVIAEAQAAAGIEPDTINYIEAHGTGTALGDPIEIAALTRAFRARTQKKGFCAIGSVKTNFGHLDEAAGVAGLIKTVLALEHKKIPPSLHFEQPNPKVDFANSPFVVNTRLSEWKTNGNPRRAGVSSFGIGGTNAHVVLEEAPEIPPSGKSRSFQLVVLSAKTPSALETATAGLAKHLRRRPDLNLADVAYTLSKGRKAFSYRKLVVCRDTREAARALESNDPKQVYDSLQEPEQSPITFMFSGQGTQYVNMGLDLYQSEATFRDQIDICSEILRPHLGFDLRHLLYPAEKQTNEATLRLKQTASTQPALFVIEYALAKLWMAWGVHPFAMIGHSIGEYVAACLAGVFSLEDALALVAARGQLMQQLPGGAMLAVPLPESEVQPYLGNKLSLAAINGSSLCVVSGPDDAVTRLKDLLAERAVECRQLETSHAFHSEMMAPLLQPFTERVRKVSLKPPQIKYLSNLTGTWIKASEATDPHYWGRHARQTVRFAEGLQELFKEPKQILLEVGPGRTLATSAMRHLEKPAETVVLTSLRHPQEVRSDVEFLITTLGKLWLTGAPVDWSGFYMNERRHRVSLPTYPFERQRYWIAPPKPGGNTATGPATSSGTGPPPKMANIDDWFYLPSWKRSFLPAREPEAMSARSCWLLFMDGCGLGSQLATRLKEDNQDVVVVTAGSQFTQLSENAYTLNPGQPDDYGALLHQLRALGKQPGTIIHLWTVTPAGTEESSLESVDRATDLGFYSLLFLAQKLGAENFTETRQLIVVSNNLQDVTGDESLCPGKALVLGPVRVIPKEYPNIRCRSIDVVLPESLNESKLVDYLLAEATFDPSPPVIAYRGHSRWEQSFEPAHLSPPPEIAPRLREGGVYLITGGLGSMGLAFANYLARTVHARLVLTSRTALPPEDEWEKWLSPSEAPIHDRFIPAPATDEKELDPIAGLEARLENTLAIRGIAGYEGLEKSLNDLCSSLIYHCFFTRKLELSNGASYGKEELKRRLRLSPKYEKFYDFFLKVLAEDEIIKPENQNIEFTQADGVPKPPVLINEIHNKYPQFQGLARLLDHCASHYDKALTGAIEGINVLYPDGTSEFLDQTAGSTVEYANDRLYMLLLAQILTDIAKKSAPRKLKLLEIGAGSGGLTRCVLESLATQNIEYHFTDIGRSFLVNAEREASHRGIDCMKFGLLDISKDPESQGYPGHSFDIILGYNVVHATPSINQTARNLIKLLVPAGLLFLVETVKPRRWVDMVWGLAEGWWYFEDDHLRTDSPLLNLDQWEQVLRNQGLANVTAYPRDATRRTDSDSGLIMARRPRQDDDGNHRASASATQHQYDARTGDRIRKLKEIRDLGSEVLTVTADVSDCEQMQAVMSAVNQRFGELNGVIHTAGVLGQGLIHAKTKDEAEKVLRPKVKGTFVLDSLLRERKLDFLVLCSSLSSISPIIGQIDYSAANAFLDAFALYRSHHNGAYTVSIDWGFWQELGMIETAAMARGLKQGIQEEIRNKGLTNAGVEAFRYVLSASRSPQVVVSPQDIRDTSQFDRALVETDSAEPLKSRVSRPEDLGAGPQSTGSGPQSGRVNHPLFDACIVEGSNQRSYITRLSPARHWVLREHRVSGESILPGTAYLEMARAAFEHCAGAGSIEIREVYFLRPLFVADEEEKEVRTVLTKQGDHYDFFVVSRANSADDRWQEHARGEITSIAADPFKKRNIKAIEAGCNRQVITITEEPRTGSTLSPGQVTGFGPRWNNLKRVSFGADQGLAVLEVPEAFAAEIGPYKLHPALLDIATGFMCIKDNFAGGFPFSYRRIKVRGPLPARIYSHGRYAKNHQPGTPKFDVTIMDEEGTELVEVEEYTLRETSAGTLAGRQAAGRHDDTFPLPDDFNFSLEISSPGSLDTLKFRPVPRKKPGPGEVEIEVCVTALNFIEVLYALGLLPQPTDFRVMFGLECAGKIAALGEGVEDFAVGDEVIAFSPASFSLFTTTSTSSIARKPAHLSLEEAATIPAAFVTAYYALVTLGRLRQGERVLIHAAAGGVGMAAVNIARWIGAEIFATAGSEEKRQFLRSLGISHVMDSRSLAFADEVMKRTDARGVDVILNSLGGEFIPRSLSILARYGRFLELGKRDIYKNTQLGLRSFEKHLSFFAIDVGPDLPDFNSVWRQVLEQFNRGTLGPLPYRLFPISEVAEAFRYMAQAKHIGKIVISIENKEALRKLVTSEQSLGVPLRSIIGSQEEPAARSNAFQEHPIESDGIKSHPEEVRLPELTHQRPGLRVAYSAPRNETEKTLAAIWQELLGIAQIGIDDDFFELRGDSLLAAQVISRSNKVFQIKLPLSSLFDAPTIASLGERIEKIRWSTKELQTLPGVAAGDQEEEGEV